MYLLAANNANDAFPKQSPMIIEIRYTLGDQLVHEMHGFFLFSRAYPSEHDEQRIPCDPREQDLLWFSKL